MPSVRRVEHDELEREFVAQQLWEEIRQGGLRQVVAARSPARRWPGGVSRILKHYRAQKHVATTHQILDRHQNIVHWDAKDKILPDGTKLTR